MKTFQDLHLSPQLICALSAQGITVPTPIQQQAYLPACENRDLIACSETGSGKTLAYLLPILSMLDAACNGIQALILVPTQELAVQVHQQIEQICSASSFSLQSLFIIGEGNIHRQIDALKGKPQIIVGTPARVAQLIKLKKLRVHLVRTLVLDEADKLLDKGYFDSVQFIRKSLMKRTQVLMFSASIDHRTRKTADLFMNKPVILDLSSSEESRIPNSIQHIYVVSDRRERIETLRKLAKALNHDRTLIFINTKYDLAEALQKLQYHHYNVAALAGNVSKQEKKKALEDFKSGNIQYLIATDVAARGLQIEQIRTVINVNLPEDPKEYLHRAGRCGRNGEKGLCISIVTENELPKLRKYQKTFRINLVQKRLYNGKLVAK